MKESREQRAEKKASQFNAPDMSLLLIRIPLGKIVMKKKKYIIN